MLTSMEAGELIANAKGSAGLSIRQLAADARVAGSTITRIRAGSVDPSVGTLERILAAAGYTLELSAIHRESPRPPRLSDLVDAWSRSGRIRLVWPRWRGFIDELVLHPERIPEAIYRAPPPSGELIVDTLLAAVAEKLADDAGLPRPAWTDQVPPLADPYEPPTARSVTARHVPTQLAARGLMIDTTSLWRDRLTTGG